MRRSIYIYLDLSFTNLQSWSVSGSISPGHSFSINSPSRSTTVVVNTNSSSSITYSIQGNLKVDIRWNGGSSGSTTVNPNPSTITFGNNDFNQKTVTLR